MNFYTYILTSLHIFVFVFILGTFIDKIFKKYQKKYNINQFISACLQLLIIITITYFIHLKSSAMFEGYSPHIMFSSFLFGLQHNMINNFENVLYNNL